MTPERIAELRKRATRDLRLNAFFGADVLECIDEIERLRESKDYWTFVELTDERDRYRAALEHIGAFVGDEDCTAQLATMARIALSAGT